MRPRSPLLRRARAPRRRWHSALWRSPSGSEGSRLDTSLGPGAATAVRSRGRLARTRAQLVPVGPDGRLQRTADERAALPRPAGLGSGVVRRDAARHLHHPDRPSGPPPEIQNVRTVALGRSPRRSRGGRPCRRPAASRTGSTRPCCGPRRRRAGPSTERRSPASRRRAPTSLDVTAKNADGLTGSSQFLLTTPVLSGPGARVDQRRDDPAGRPAVVPEDGLAQCVDGVGSNLADGIDLFMGNGCGTGAQLAHWVTGRAYVVADAQAPAAERAGSVGNTSP